MYCPLLAEPVPAGFPSPASDFVEDQLSLDAHLIEHQEATFFMRVTGQSMTQFGIHDGDLLVVDRALDPTDRSVVIAVVDGAFTSLLRATAQPSLLERTTTGRPSRRGLKTRSQET